MLSLLHWFSTAAIVTNYYKLRGLNNIIYLTVLKVRGSKWVSKAKIKYLQGCILSGGSREESTYLLLQLVEAACVLSL